MATPNPVKDCAEMNIEKIDRTALEDNSKDHEETANEDRSSSTKDIDVVGDKRDGADRAKKHNSIQDAED